MMTPDKLDPELKLLLLTPPAEPIPIDVTFTGALSPGELAALGLSSAGGAMATGEVTADAIRSLAARDDVVWISRRPELYPSSP